MDNFLPSDAQEPARITNYVKFNEGDTTFRALSSALTGFVWFVDKPREDGSPGRSPVRVKQQDDVDPSFSDEAKYFWAFVVWNRDLKRLQICEIVQKSVRDGIGVYLGKPKFGDPKRYDITVTKTINKDLPPLRGTKYSVTADPPEALEPEIVKLYQEAQIDLAALYRGDDPFVSEKPLALGKVYTAESPRNQTEDLSAVMDEVVTERSNPYSETLI